MIQKLTDYINGTCSYFEACSIFAILCTNKRISALLLKSDSIKNQEKLRYEIKKILSNHPQALKIDKAIVEQLNIEIKPKSVAQKEVVSFPSVKQSIAFPANISSDKTPLHQKVLLDRNQFMKERSHFHGCLHEAQDDERRYELANEIILIQPKIDELNRELRMFEKGEIPEKYLAKHLTGEEVIQRRNAKQYIGRLQKQLANEFDPGKIQQIKERIAKYQKILNEI